MQDALAGMQAAGALTLTGADADHLKTTEDVTRTVDAGFCFFTIDPSDHVDQAADDYSAAQLREKFAAIADQIQFQIDQIRKDMDGPGQARTVIGSDQDVDDEVDQRHRVCLRQRRR